MESRELVIKKITEMSGEQVSKVLIFMAGMEAERMLGAAGEQTAHEDRGGKRESLVQGA